MSGHSISSLNDKSFVECMSTTSGLLAEFINV